MVVMSGTEEEYRKHRNENLENYQNGFMPLLKKGEYEEAFNYLLKNPEVEQEVKGHEWREMCRGFFIKLKGLEGKTEDGMGGMHC